MADAVTAVRLATRHALDGVRVRTVRGGISSGLRLAQLRRTPLLDQPAQSEPDLLRRAPRARLPEPNLGTWVGPAVAQPGAVGGGVFDARQPARRTFRPSACCEARRTSTSPMAPTLGVEAPSRKPFDCSSERSPNQSRSVGKVATTGTGTCRSGRNRYSGRIHRFCCLATVPIPPASPARWAVTSASASSPRNRARPTWRSTARRQRTRDGSRPRTTSSTASSASSARPSSRPSAAVPIRTCSAGPRWTT